MRWFFKLAVRRLRARWQSLLTLIIGVLLGLGLAYLILPFLALIGSQTLQLPLMGILLLLLVFVIAFVLILRLTAAILHRFSLNQVMRFGE